MECPGTPRPTAQDIQLIEDRRGLVFGLGGRTNLNPPPSPNSPARPVPAIDRTYRSLFQQPAIEVQPAHAESDWYDFLFQPAKLLAHTKSLKVDPTKTPTAHDVLTELLRKAKPINPTSEPTARDNTLLCLAALVVLQLNFTLEDIEATIQTNLQKGLFDGLVQYATDPRILKLHDVEKITLDEAQILRARWQLRITIRKMLVCAMTIPNRLPLSDNPKQPPDEVEQLQSITGLVPIPQLLDELQQTHLKSQSLNDTDRNGINMDLGVYYFHKKQFAAALACFETIPLSTDKVLAGYVKACQSVVGKPASGHEEQLDVWWNQGKYAKIVEQLEKENKNARNDISNKYRSQLEYLINKRLRAQEQDDPSYKKIQILNVIHSVLASPPPGTIWIDTAIFSFQRISKSQELIKYLHQQLDLLVHDVKHLVDLKTACERVFPLKRKEIELAQDTIRQRRVYDGSLPSGLTGEIAIAQKLLHTSSWAELKGRTWSTSNDSEMSFLALASSCGGLMEASLNRTTFNVKVILSHMESVIVRLVERKNPDDYYDLPISVLDTCISLAAGLLQRAYALNLCDYRISYDLVPYGDLAILIAFASNDQNGAMDPVQSMKVNQSDLVQLHGSCLSALLKRSPRDPRWHCASADVSVNPIVLQKLSSAGDFKSAVRSYLVAASLATNFFADIQFADIIDHSSLVRLSYCLVKLGAHVAAAVLYQTFAPEETAYGLRILQLSPQQHDPAFFQYIWEFSYLETLVYLHTKQKNTSYVETLTQLIQCPELNASNPSTSKKEMEMRIFRSYFRELCRHYLVHE